MRRTTSFVISLFARFKSRRRSPDRKSPRNFDFMELSFATRDELFANHPSLQKFALSLFGTIDGEDDTVLEMRLRALSRAEYVR